VIAATLDHVMKLVQPLTKEEKAKISAYGSGRKLVVWKGTRLALVYGR
jgi:hypothetical protein